MLSELCVGMKQPRSKQAERNRERNLATTLSKVRTSRTLPFSIFPSRQRLGQTERLISFLVGQCGARPDHVISSVDL